VVGGVWLRDAAPREGPFSVLIFEHVIKGKWVWFRLSLATLALLIATTGVVVAAALACVPPEFVRAMTQPLLSLVSALPGGVLR